MKKASASVLFLLCATIFQFVGAQSNAVAQTNRPNVRPSQPTNRPNDKRVAPPISPVVQKTSFSVKSVIVHNGVGASVAPKPLSVAALERRVFEVVNRKRLEAGLPPAVWSDDAARVARIHSQNMAAYNFFSHQGRDGMRVSERATAAGFRKWHALGENIAYNRGYGNPLESVVQSWMNSAGHRANMLNSRWDKTGVGIAVTANGTYYFTQVFFEK